MSCLKWRERKKNNKKKKKDYVVFKWKKKGGLFNFNYTISLIKEKVCYVSMVFLGIKLRKVNVLQKQGLLLLKYIMFSPIFFTFVWNL